MFSGEKTQLPEGSFFISAAAAWLLSACVLLAAATLAANLTGMGEQGMGILSSALSFLCAAAAGRAAAKKQRTKKLLTAFLTSAMLVILLLTVGFLIQGPELDPSSILSLVSFTYAGVFFGVCVLSGSDRRAIKRPCPARKLT